MPIKQEREGDSQIATLIVFPTVSGKRYRRLLLSIISKIVTEGENNIRLIALRSIDSLLTRDCDLVKDDKKQVPLFLERVKVALNQIDVSFEYECHDLINLKSLNFLIRALFGWKDIALHSNLNLSLNSALWHNHSSSSIRKRNNLRAAFLRWMHYSAYLQVFHFLISRNNIGEVTKVLIPNGRNPSQLAVTHFGEAAKIKMLFYERGIPADNSLFLQSFQIQDPDKMKAFFVTWRTNLSQNDIELFCAWSKERLDKIISDPTENQFLNFLQEKSYVNPLDNRHAIIFTSSIDDKTSNFPMELNGWKSQTSAIIEVANHLKEQGLTPLVRIHPNAMNKNVYDLWSICKNLRRANIDFILPWTGPSAIDLIKDSSLVFTWASSTCIIARAFEKKTYNLTPIWYDSFLQVNVCGPESLKSQNLDSLLLTNSSRSASREPLLALYFREHLGEPLNELTLLPVLREFPEVSHSAPQKVMARQSEKSFGNLLLLLLTITLSGSDSKLRHIIDLLTFLLGKSISLRLINWFFAKK